MTEEKLLHKIVAKPKEMQSLMRRHGLKIDDLDDPMQKLAFTFYTELCALSWEAENVLEHSARLAEVEREAIRLQGNLSAQIAITQMRDETIDTLQRENERLREALEFYADPETYFACTFLFDKPTGGFDEDFDETHGHEHFDRPMPGKLAREALHSARPGEEA